MTNAVEERKILEKRIVEAQEKLQQKEPDHALLTMVEVDSMGIHWNEGFYDRYGGMKVIEGLNKYAGELEEAYR